MKNSERAAVKNPLARTMSEFIYNDLKEEIINNRIKANQRINEKELSEKFRVSRTPVREAVLRLAAEGFVHIDSYRRAVVKEISYEELKEIYQVLGALDRLAVGISLENMILKSVRKLEKIFNKMEKYCSIDSIERYLDLNTEFHNEIWLAVDNAFLKETLFSIRDKLFRYNYVQIYAFKQPGALEKSLQQHKDLIQAIINKNKPRLEALIVKHRGSLWDLDVYNNGMKDYLQSEEA
jgi:DNA-binding GntR family transcriptional regulator